MARILVADDDTVMLRLLETLLQLEGHETITVTRPESVVPAARSHMIELILMDYHLAGGDALGVLRELREDDSLRSLPVLVTSGMDCEIECLRAGADCFLLKPFGPAELLKRVQSMLVRAPRTDQGGRS